MLVREPGDPRGAQPTPRDPSSGAGHSTTCPALSMMMTAQQGWRPTTILGEWTYVAGASKYPPHLKELKEIKYATFSFSPGRHENELNTTEIMRVNETCVRTNSSKILIFQHNSTLMHVYEQVHSTAHLIQTDKDLLLLQHRNGNVPGLSLSARTLNVSKEHLEEFKAHLHCLGFTEDEVFFVSEKVRALPEAMARVITILGLVALMPATAVPCRAPRLDNTTASKPGAGDRELLVTQHVAAGDQCLTNNSTYFEVAAGDAMLVKHAERHQIMGTLMNLSSEDVLLIQYQPQGERTYLGLYLYARNLSASTAHREEFERRAKSLGLSEERIVYAPWKRTSPQRPLAREEHWLSSGVC
nr:PREDICTED: uncharacterized protein LOC104330233 [Opisthocomus hoazin]